MLLHSPCAHARPAVRMRKVILWFKLCILALKMPTPWQSS